MADPRYGSYRDLAKNYEKQLDTLLEQGIFKPIFLYHVVILHILPLIGLVIPRSRGGQYVRKSLFVLCIAIAIEILQNRRAIIGGNGYMLGLITAWWLVWNTTLFVFTDLEHHFKRIERKPVDIKSQNDPSIEPSTVTSHPTRTIQHAHSGTATFLFGAHILIILASS
jgi:hypothetical protein